MSNRAPISVDHYFRELQALARSRERKTNTKSNVIDFMEAKRRLLRARRAPDR